MGNMSTHKTEPHMDYLNLKQYNHKKCGFATSNSPQPPQAWGGVSIVVNRKLRFKKANNKPLLEYSYDKDGKVVELKAVTGNRVQSGRR